MIASVVFLLAPFAAYVPAEELHVSGVLAAVSAGILLSRRSTSFIDPETRVLGSNVWRLLTFVLNAFAFLLIGLELPTIIETLEPHVRDYAIYGLLVSATVILVRIAWIFPATYLPRLLSRRLRERDPYPAWRQVAVMSWAGMRGIVSLAIALALPYTLGDQPFPAAQRDDFLYLLRDLRDARAAGPHPRAAHRMARRDGVRAVASGARATLRIRALEAGIARLEDMEAGAKSPLEREIADRILEEYRQRIDVLRGKVTKDEADRSDAKAESIAGSEGSARGGAPSDRRDAVAPAKFPTTSTGRSSTTSILRRCA